MFSQRKFLPSGAEIGREKEDDLNTQRAHCASVKPLGSVNRWCA